MAKRLDLLGSNQKKELAETGSFTTSRGSSYTPTAGDVANTGGAQPVTDVPVQALENPGKPVEIPQVEVDPAIANSTVAVAQGFDKEQQALAKKDQASVDTQSDTVRELMEITGQRGADTATTMEASAAGSQGQKELADMMTMIRGKSARLSEFDDDTFLGEEALRANASSRDITQGAFNAKSRERRLQRAIDRTGAAAELRVNIAEAELVQNNIAAATAQVEAAMEARYSPYEQSLENEMFFLQREWQKADKSEQRAYESRMNVVQQQQNEITDAKSMVTNAMPYTTPEELKAMNDPNLTPAEQYEMAQEVTSRGMRQERAREIADKYPVTVASTGEVLEIPTFEEYAKEHGGKAYAMEAMSPVQMQKLRDEYNTDMEVMTRASAMTTISPFAAEILKNPKGFFNLTNTRKGEVLEELANAGIDTAQIQEGKKRQLATSQVEDMRQANLARDNVQSLYDMLQALPGTGPVAGRLAALDKWDEDFIRVQAQINRTVPGLARGIFQEVGVLTDVDVDRYTTTLANPEATAEQIEALHNDTMKLIDRSIQGGIKLYSDLGYDLGDYTEAGGGTDTTNSEVNESEVNENDPLGLNI